MDSSLVEMSQDNDVAISRLEDVEDNMQVVKNDINVAKIQLALAEREIHLLDLSMDNAHKQLEDLGDRVDGFVGSLCWNRSYTQRDFHMIRTELESFQKEMSSQIKSWSRRFEHNNEVIDKKFVQLDMELEKVVDLAGGKY
jgi:SMC interacting uncharacterized protein involved in chromosome segregation